MILYAYICDTCGTTEERSFPMGHAAKSPKCKCGKLMRRDYAGEQQIIHDDPEVTQSDIDQNIAEIKSGKEVNRPVLAQSLAHVPGVRKVRGKDGRQYAMFRTKKERREVCARIGLPY